MPSWDQKSFLKKGFHYVARRALIAMAMPISETRAEASALDINWNNHPTPKWSSVAFGSQKHPNVLNLSLQI